MGYCGWDSLSELDREYHDKEWGVPLHDDRKQFEFLTMEVMQCGLSWGLMLKKREVFRTCFENYDYEKIAAYGDEDIVRIISTPDMIASPAKVRAVIGNARSFLQIQKEYGSFSVYLWNFVNGKTIIYQGHNTGWVPVSNRLSDKISKDMKKRGFKYLGSITIYSHLQACGIINDHDEGCPCYRKIVSAYPCVVKKRYGEKRFASPTARRKGLKSEK